MSAASWNTINHADVRLVVCDMDGTLLTSAGQLPPGFDAVCAQLYARGAVFVPASGRQLAMLERMFPHLVGGSFIAENGSIVVRDGRVVSRAAVERGALEQLVGITRAAAGQFDLGLVYCGASGAYIERGDAAFLAEVRKYYANFTVVDDLFAVQEPAVKLAVFDFTGSQAVADALLGDIARKLHVVVSSANWVDVMVPGVNKGVGVRALQDALGVAPAQTVVFGDYLNDLEMLAAGEVSFAMANAHPQVRAAARYIAPSNDEFGVVRVLTRLLALPSLCE